MPRLRPRPDYSQMTMRRDTPPKVVDSAFIASLPDATKQALQHEAVRAAAQVIVASEGVITSFEQKDGKCHFKIEAQAQRRNEAAPQPIQFSVATRPEASTAEVRQALQKNGVYPVNQSAAKSIFGELRM